MKNVSDWESWDWTYATRDLKALNQMRERLINIGSRYGLISYTDLVKGITFKMNGVHDGNTFQITPDNWCGLYRRIVGDMLGYLSLETFNNHGFWCSAMVIGRAESQPSDIFFQWMVDLEVIDGKDDSYVLPFWSQQVAKAHKHYRKVKRDSEN